VKLVSEMGVSEVSTARRQVHIKNAASSHLIRQASVYVLISWQFASESSGAPRSASQVG
jgi:hypothetical protein